jgi:hypothetical protein
MSGPIKSYFLNAAITGLRWYIGSGVFDRVSGLVRLLMFSDLSGGEKRAKVFEFAENEYGIVGGAVSRKLKYGIAAVVEVTLLQHEVSADNDE